MFCGGGELNFPLRIDKVESNVALHEMERTESQMAVLALEFCAHFLCNVRVIDPKWAMFGLLVYLTTTKVNFANKS